MTVPIFVDSNVVVYAVGKASDKRSVARNMLASGAVISTQVVNETINVLTRKQGATLTVAHEIAESLLVLCEVVPVEVATIREAMRLTRRYSLSHWDALIIGAALLADCSTLYSQDMQHGQVIDGRLTLVNPFV